MLFKEIVSGIDKKIKEKLSQLELTPEKTLNHKLISKLNRYYVTICFDKNRGKYIFKSSLKDEKSARSYLNREIYFHRQISNYFSKKINFVPNHITSKKQGKFIWILREYADGQMLGQLREVNPDLLKEKHIATILNQILISRKILQRIFANEKCSYKISRTTYAYKFYLKEKDCLDYDPVSFKKIEEYQTKQLDFQKILNFYREHKKLLSNSLTIPVHGDLNPQNIIISGDKINIIDWERIHYDNLPGEIDFLWASVWNRPDWRKKFLKRYFINVKNKKEFIILWRLAIMARCWGEAWCWYHQIKKNSDEKFVRKCEQAIINNLCYLYRASQGFEGFI